MGLLYVLMTYEEETCKDKLQKLYMLYVVVCG